MLKTAKTMTWLDVPGAVDTLFDQCLPTAMDLVRDSPCSLNGWSFEAPDCGTVLIKRAGLSPRSGHSLSMAVQRMLGGPNAFTAGILGAALGTALGYGGGWLARKFLPDYVDDRLARNMAPLGAILGGGLPLWFHGSAPIKEHGISGMFYKSPFQSGSAGSMEQFFKALHEVKASDDKEQQDILERIFRKTFGNDGEKQAAYNPTYRLLGLARQSDNQHTADMGNVNVRDPIAGSYAPDVHSTEFGVAVLEDPFLDDRTKAIVAAMTLAAGKTRHSAWVSPMDIARVSTAAGLGSAMGRAIGELAGPFLGLTPKARREIQRAGLLSGAIKMIAGSMI